MPLREERIYLKFNFDEPFDRRGTGCWEWSLTDEYVRANGMGDKMPEDAICLSTADMDFRCPPCIKDALQKVVDINSYGYFSADPLLAPDYVNAVANWFKRRYNWEIDPSDVQYTNGTIEALRICVKTFTKEGDGVLITPPVYYPFSSIIEETKRVRVPSHLINEDMNYSINWEDFEAKAALPTTKMCIFCSPHNPSGRVWTVEELKRVYDICTKHGVLLVADELHADLIRTNQTFHSFGEVTDGKNLIVCTGANKTFNIAGLQASHVVTTNPELKAKLYEITSGIYPSPFTIQAVIAAYNEGEEWLEELKAYLDENLKYAVDFLHEHMPKVKAIVPEGTYLLWMDFREYGLTDEEIYHRIFDLAGVTYDSGAMFDPEHGQGFVRLALGTQRSIEKRALERIAAQF